MKLISALALFILFSFQLFGGTKEDSVVIVRKSLAAIRVEEGPKIDGVLDDEAWKNANTATDFIQYSPIEKAPVSFPTEVKIIYNNSGIFIGAMCYDNSPDSIKRQLGLRDDYINADNFLVRFDTYNTQQDAFTFSVSASGVQSDNRMSDYNFNAVWQSDVKILPNGWSVEMAIPWSALRFPTSEKQIWGLQLARNIQRKFEYDQWCQTPKTASNAMKYWGLLTGLDNIQEPVRLSLTPYLSTVIEKDDRFGHVNPSASLGGGMGLKYGINESFTLDMTLLPDFSQVRSDNIVKNLSPFEIQYSEQRPFFTEGTDLFQRGGIFYSRRIGKTPEYFYDAPYLCDSTEKIIKNPTQSRLLNATKISGRTNNGMGIGILNAFVDNTYAIAQDTITGKQRKILTDPSTNFNIFVFDKQLQNSSNVFVTHTNVIRSHGFRSADVTASGFSLNNKKNTFNINGVGGVSNVLDPLGTGGNFTSKIGYYYNIGMSKTGGKFQYGITRQVVNKDWDCNDMGINLETNYANENLDWSYNIYNPWKIFNNAFFNVNVSYSSNLTTKEMSSISVNSFNMATFRNYWSMYCGTEIQPVDSKDYYEPRVAGRYYIRTRSNSFFGGINSNENNPFSYGLSFHFGQTAKISETIPKNPWGGAGVNLNWRVGNRFNLGVNGSFHGDFGDRGWVDEEDDGTIVFGRRIIHTFENSASANFVFIKDMSVSIIARHFWETGHYLGYYILNDDGTLTDYVNYNIDHDFSFNSFNVDLVYNWIFAPGSTLSISWKQNILGESTVIDYDYMNNFTHTLHGPQFNQVSVRVLYYIDYNSVKTHLDRKK